MGANNKYLFTIPAGTKSIQLPIELKWDNLGQSDSIELWEKTAIEEVIGLAKDFDILRFGHDEYGTDQQTRVNYKFYFYNEIASSWDNDYQAEGFTTEENYYISNSFEKSFFKLDFYDSNTATTQTNYFTVILPVQQGLTETAVISSLRPPVQVKIPTMNLDFVGDKEGFFLYWLRKKDFLDIDTFYMSAKFFDGRKGEFIRMLTRPQSSFPSKFQFDPSIYFYYKVELDYDSHTYKIFDILTNEPRGEYVPFPTNQYKPVSWYEFINPE